MPTRPSRTDATGNPIAGWIDSPVPLVDASGLPRKRRRVDPVELAHLRRARDLMDRYFAEPLDVPAMASHAAMSPSHFSRRFKATYGETPYNYLMTRRIERAMALLRQGVSVTDACFAVGCTSLGSFSSRFNEVVGESPSSYAIRDHSDHEVIPPCISMLLTRPQRFPLR